MWDTWRCSRIVQTWYRLELKQQQSPGRPLPLAISFEIHDLCIFTAMPRLFPFMKGWKRSHGGRQSHQAWSWGSLPLKVTGRNQLTNASWKAGKVCPGRAAWLEVEPKCSFKEKKKKALLLTGYFWVLGLLFFFSLLPICSLSSFNKLIPAAYSEQENTIYMKIKQINLVFSGKAFKHTKLLRLVVS